MKVCAITATCGRHSCLERSIRFFLDQDYAEKTLLIYQNSIVFQRLNSNTPKNVILINQCRNSANQPYTCLGEIYNDAINHVPVDTDVLIFWDDDDIFLPNHMSEGIKGLQRGGKKAYKPARSIYKEKENLVLVSNTLEPSMFVQFSHIKKYGFKNTTSDQHLSWIEPLVRDSDIFVDPEGIPTYICDWSQEIGTFKTSGNPYHDHNFSNYRSHSVDHGDGIITPISAAKAEIIYKQFDK